ncbi:MAG: DUF951 domain-containing protein [Chloroflexota bacterium]
MEIGSFKYQLGDVVVMKKGHPCGTNRWEVIRTGMDFRLKCLGCGRTVMLPRPEFERAVREVHRDNVLVASTKMTAK